MIAALAIRGWERRKCGNTEESGVNGVKGGGWCQLLQSKASVARLGESEMRENPMCFFRGEMVNSLCETWQIDASCLFVSLPSPVFFVLVGDWNNIHTFFFIPTTGTRSGVFWCSQFPFQLVSFHCIVPDDIQHCYGLL